MKLLNPRIYYMQGEDIKLFECILFTQLYTYFKLLISYTFQHLRSHVQFQDYLL
jgi:hypothetical protein